MMKNAEKNTATLDTDDLNKIEKQISENYYPDKKRVSMGSIEEHKSDNLSKSGSFISHGGRSSVVNKSGLKSK